MIVTSPSSITITITIESSCPTGLVGLGLQNALRVRERILHRALGAAPHEQWPHDFIVAEEYGNWEDSHRRIDLSAVHDQFVHSPLWRESPTRTQTFRTDRAWLIISPAGYPSDIPHVEEGHHGYHRREERRRGAEGIRGFQHRRHGDSHRAVRRDRVVAHAGNSSAAGDAIGRDAVFAQFVRYGGETAGTFKATLRDVFASPDGKVVGLHHNSGERNGEQLDTDCCIVFELDNGRIVSGREHFYDLTNWDQF